MDEITAFTASFSAKELHDAFKASFSTSQGKGLDRINGFQYGLRAQHELKIASKKCLDGTFRFTPFLEKLKTKGRGEKPRLISIPTIRDRVILHQLNRHLARVFPECVPINVASTYVRDLSEELKSSPLANTWICGCDIKTFYDSINRDRLLKIISKRIKCWQATYLIKHAIQTPTVPANCQKYLHKKYKTNTGVPQGLAISNILAAIYMSDIDSAMNSGGVSYRRYVDDVIMHGEKELVEKAYKSLRARLLRRNLSAHPLGSEKSYIRHASEQFNYLGYTFSLPHITVREATHERFLQSISAKFSDHKHNKAKRLERYSYLTSERLIDIFLLELNEKISGAISGNKRYGWIAYFSQISDLTILHRMDCAIASMFKRLSDFADTPESLKKLSRAYFEIKFNPNGGYVRNYDLISSPAEKIQFLQDRGRVSPTETLSDEEINARFDRYVSKSLADMHADEGGIYG